jgi:hypothetical protein
VLCFNRAFGRGLIEGLDEIDVTLEMEPQSADFWERATDAYPWAYQLPG